MNVSANLFEKFFVLVLISTASGIKFSLETISDLPVLLKEGKQQYDVLKVNAQAPQYGTCWANAVSSLHVGCRDLTQELQSALALRLTDCFLQMSGQGSIACTTPRHECLQQLSDREFNAYTEFFTHTQNICYFLQSRLWHEQSEKTIDRLSSTSYKVSQQLVEAEKGQEALLRQQRESLNNQEEMARHVEASRQTMGSIMEELQVSAREQQLALSSLFQKLATLQSWAVGELSWFDSVFFYLSAAVLSCLFSSAARTSRARLPLLIVLTLNYCLERCCCIYFNDGSYDVNDTTSNLYGCIWILRKGAVSLCFILLTITALKYWDYNAINHQILVQITKQNSEMREMLRKLSARDITDSVLVPSKGKDIFLEQNANWGELSMDTSREGTPHVFNTSRHTAYRNQISTPVPATRAANFKDPEGSSELDNKNPHCEIVSENSALRRSTRLRK